MKWKADHYLRVFVLLFITYVLISGCGHQEELCLKCHYELPCVISFDTTGSAIDTFCMLSHESDSDFYQRYLEHILGQNFEPVDTAYLDTGYYLKCFEGPDLLYIDSIRLVDTLGYHCHTFRNIR